MLNENQEQSVSGGSLAVQAGGNVTIVGLSLVEVRELCNVFLRDNFPKLREEARQAAEENVKQFANQLETKLANNLAAVVVDKFRDPEVQATINDAVQATARKGEAANPDILANLILKKVSTDCGSFKDIVFAEAVQVAPKLTREQIAFLAFVLFVQTFVFGAKTPEQLESLSQIVWSFSSPGFDLSESQRQHIHYTGAASVAGKTGVYTKYDMYANMGTKYVDKGWGDFRTVVNQQVPTLAKLLAKYDKDNGYAVEVTSVGMAIALAYVSNYLGQLDFSMWIN